METPKQQQKTFTMPNFPFSNTWCQLRATNLESRKRKWIEINRSLKVTSNNFNQFKNAMSSYKTWTSSQVTEMLIPWEDLPKTISKHSKNTCRYKNYFVSSTERRVYTVQELLVFVTKALVHCHWL